MPTLGDDYSHLTFLKKHSYKAYRMIHIFFGTEVRVSK